eukprot:TRINITY_DN41535_c0_g1_i1.p1 TRINITY_DN41535_c0_g1~~TRINITY_DN41535_c0_g1_i1.p1  ORF type:complete len:877 (-),score=216.47 TRINITY_DN41535_c0_g1_i1:121-2751(-)
MPSKPKPPPPPIETAADDEAVSRKLQELREASRLVVRNTFIDYPMVSPLGANGRAVQSCPPTDLLKAAMPRPSRGPEGGSPLGANPLDLVASIGAAAAAGGEGSAASAGGGCVLTPSGAAVDSMGMRRSRPHAGSSGTSSGVAAGIGLSSEPLRVVPSPKLSSAMERHSLNAIRTGSPAASPACPWDRGVLDQLVANAEMAMTPTLSNPEAVSPKKSGPGGIDPVAAAVASASSGASEGLPLETLRHCAGSEDNAGFGSLRGGLQGFGDGPLASWGPLLEELGECDSASSHGGSEAGGRKAHDEDEGFQRAGMAEQAARSMLNDLLMGDDAMADSPSKLKWKGAAAGWTGDDDEAPYPKQDDCDAASSGSQDGTSRVVVRNTFIDYSAASPGQPHREVQSCPPTNLMSSAFPRSGALLGPGRDGVDPIKQHVDLAAALGSLPGALVVEGEESEASPATADNAQAMTQQPKKVMLSPTLLSAVSATSPQGRPRSEASPPMPSAPAAMANLRMDSMDSCMSPMEALFRADVEQVCRPFDPVRQAVAFAAAGANEMPTKVEEPSRPYPMAPVQAASGKGAAADAAGKDAASRRRQRDLAQRGEAPGREGQAKELPPELLLKVDEFVKRWELDARCRKVIVEQLSAEEVREVLKDFDASKDTKNKSAKFMVWMDSRICRNEAKKLAEQPPPAPVSHEELTMFFDRWKLSKKSQRYVKALGTAMQRTLLTSFRPPPDTRSADAKLCAFVKFQQNKEAARAQRLARYMDSNDAPAGDTRTGSHHSNKTQAHGGAYVGHQQQHPANYAPLLGTQGYPTFAACGQPPALWMHADKPMLQMPQAYPGAFMAGGYNGLHHQHPGQHPYEMHTLPMQVGYVGMTNPG